MEEANPCHFLVIYEDAAAHDLAMEVCRGVMSRFDADLTFAFNFWKVRDLQDPVLAHWAAEAVAYADIILFSVPGHDLAPEAVNWLDACVPTRRKSEGALALTITEPAGAGLATEALLSRLQFAAYRLRMDFLPLLSSSAGVKLGAPSNPPLAAPDRVRDDAGSNHWGLNE